MIHSFFWCHLLRFHSFNLHAIVLDSPWQRPNISMNKILVFLSSGPQSTVLQRLANSDQTYTWTSFRITVKLQAPCINNALPAFWHIAHFRICALYLWLQFWPWIQFDVKFVFNQKTNNATNLQRTNIYCYGNNKLTLDCCWVSLNCQQNESCNPQSCRV